MISHEFPLGAPRCIYCGTLATQHERTACPGPQGHPVEKLRPEPARRVYASEDHDAIYQRIKELSVEGDVALNIVHADQEGGVQH